jgi:hypothetical protein
MSVYERYIKLISERQQYRWVYIAMDTNMNFLKLGWTVEDKMYLDTISKEYIKRSPHIALEYADKMQQWDAFKYILNTNRKRLWTHYQMTTGCFDYNIDNLSEEERNEVLSDPEEGPSGP